MHPGVEYRPFAEGEHVDKRKIIQTGNTTVSRLVLFPRWSIGRDRT